METVELDTSEIDLRERGQLTLQKSLRDERLLVEMRAAKSKLPQGLTPREMLAALLALGKVATANARP